MNVALPWIFAINLSNYCFHLFWLWFSDELTVVLLCFTRLFGDGLEFNVFINNFRSYLFCIIDGQLQITPAYLLMCCTALVNVASLLLCHACFTVLLLLVNHISCPSIGCHHLSALRSTC